MVHTGEGLSCRSHPVVLPTGLNSPGKLPEQEAQALVSRKHQFLFQASKYCNSVSHLCAIPTNSLPFLCLLLASRSLNQLWTIAVWDPQSFGLSWRIYKPISSSYNNGLCYWIGSFRRPWHHNSNITYMINRERCASGEWMENRKCQRPQG
jgi:hypothetical protein